jgi:hypothetical protein
VDGIKKILNQFSLLPESHPSLKDGAYTKDDATPDVALDEERGGGDEEEADLN